MPQTGCVSTRSMRRSRVAAGEVLLRTHWRQSASASAAAEAAHRSLSPTASRPCRCKISRESRRAAARAASSSGEMPSCVRNASSVEPSASSSRSASHRAGSGKPRDSSRETSGAQAVSAAAGSGMGCAGPGVRVSTARRKASMPLPRAADIGSTGTPSRDASFSVFGKIPFFSASSHRFMQMITFPVISRICSARIKLRSAQVASHTTITASGAPKQRKSRVIRSSSERAVRE